MQKYDLELETYWVVQSSYFRLTTTVAFTIPFWLIVVAQI